MADCVEIEQDTWCEIQVRTFEELLARDHVCKYRRATASIRGASARDVLPVEIVRNARCMSGVTSANFHSKFLGRSAVLLEAQCQDFIRIATQASRDDIFNAIEFSGTL